MRPMRGGALDGRGARAGDDLEEAADVEAGAAEERAVDVGQRRQFADVVRLDAAAVEDVALIGGGAAEPLAQARADVRVRLAGLRRRRVAAGADRPDRLVGNHERGDLIAAEAVESLFDLPVEY